MNITITGITRTIAIAPELVRTSLAHANDAYPLLLALASGDYPAVQAIMADRDEVDGGDEPDVDDALQPWAAGRRALEITMLIRSHRDFPQGHREAMHAAMGDLDSPQHAADIVLALASMFNHVVEDEEIAMFAQSFLDAETRTP